MKKYLKEKIRKTPIFPIVKRTFNVIDFNSKKGLNKIRHNGLILLYHRVNNIAYDPHQLCVSPENFYNQLNFLKNNYDIVPLKDLVGDLKAKNIRKGKVALTFDDGYADNLYNALPIIEKMEVPCTVFIATNIIKNRDAFYWDKQHAGNEPLTKDELIKLAKSNFVEIGSHTMSHLRLANAPISTQRYEIVQSKKILENTLNKRVESFSYPFGGTNTFTQETINIVKQTGYEYACGNAHRRVFNNSDTHNLPRYVVRNWDINRFKKELSRFV